MGVKDKGLRNVEICISGQYVANLQINRISYFLILMCIKIKDKKYFRSKIWNKKHNIISGKAA